MIISLGWGGSDAWMIGGKEEDTLCVEFVAEISENYKILYTTVQNKHTRRKMFFFVCERVKGWKRGEQLIGAMERDGYMGLEGNAKRNGMATVYFEYSETGIGRNINNIR